MKPNREKHTKHETPKEKPNPGKNEALFVSNKEEGNIPIEEQGRRGIKRQLLPAARQSLPVLLRTCSMGFRSRLHKS